MPIRAWSQIFPSDGLRPSRICRFLKLARTIAFLLVLCPCGRAWALASASITTLTLSANGAAATTSVSGTAVTLTAAVTVGNAVQPQGLVSFCDASATYCEDIHLLGTAQLNSSGMAVLRFLPSIGTHTYKAVFAGTNSSAPSSSANSTLSVTGVYPTTTTISASGQQGNFSLTATVASASQSLSATGTANFLDESRAGMVLGSASLTPGGVAFNLLPAPVPSLVGQTIATGDFNGDGKVDLVSADYQGNLYVALGAGDGTFTALPAAPLLAYTQTQQIVTGDFNSDGKVDLVVVGNGNILTVLLGNGDGTFVVGSLPSMGLSPVSIVVGDWNGDGISDLAVSNGGDNSVSILLGNNDGTFSAGTNFPTNAGPATIISADFNNDGKSDLAVLTQTDYVITVFLGAGDGTFTKLSTPALTSFDLGYMVVGDFNGDGKPDIAVTSYVSEIIILSGNGDGTFTDTGVVQMPIPPGSIVTGDFNGDGKTDIAALNGNGVDNQDGAIILLGNGDGTFALNGPYPGVFSFSLAAAADFNGDGETDLAAVGGYTSNGTTPLTVSLAQGGVTATATAPMISPVGDDIHQVVASYVGDTNFAAGVSPSIGIQAQPLTTQLTVTATPGASTYGQQVLLMATLSPSSAPGVDTNSESVTFSSNGSYLGTGTLMSGVATLNVTSLMAGADTLTATYQGDNNFSYAVSPGTNFTVASATLTVVPVNATRSYGQQNPFFSGSVTGAINGDMFTVTGTSTATPSSPAGTYPITYTVYGYNINDYSVNYVTGTLTVTAATPAITWPVPAAITYGAALTTTQLDAMSSTAGGFAYNPALGAVLGAGAQPLQAMFSPNDATDFTAVIAKNSLVVNKAPLTISANSGTRVYGLPNPTFTGSIAGAVNGDVLTESFTTTATAMSNVATYPIIPGVTGAAVNNYAQAPTNGTLTITQAGTTTSLAALNENLTFTATVASLTTGVPTGIVGFYQGQTLVGTGPLINGSAAYTAPLTPAGGAVITAQYAGDINFTPSTSPAAQLLSVAPASSSLSVAQSGSVTDVLTIAATPGYTGTVQLTCSGLPQDATCSFQPASIAFTSASNSAAVTLTISTGATTGRLSTPPLTSGRSHILFAVSFFWIPGLSLLALRRRRTGRALPSLFLSLLLCGLASGAVGCSGGGGGSQVKTPDGTSTIQVVASGTGGLTQTTNLTLTIQ